jgi:hypothetical protein
MVGLMNWKGHGRKRSWPNLSGRAEENHKTPVRIVGLQAII